MVLSLCKTILITMVESSSGNYKNCQILSYQSLRRYDKEERENRWFSYFNKYLFYIIKCQNGEHQIQVQIALNKLM